MVTNKMNWSAKHSRIILEIICLLYILLFAYAAVSKLLDFESFRIQLAQSPLLSSHTDWVAWTVPLRYDLCARPRPGTHSGFTVVATTTV